MAEWLYRFLGAVVGGGFVGALTNSWISHKIEVYHQNKIAHLENLRDQVLVPLRSGLQTHFKPFLFQQRPLVSVVSDAKQFKDGAKVTEDQATIAPLLAAAFPFGRVFDGIEPALLEDAKSRHFPKLIVGMDALLKDWADYARDCHTWISGMAVRMPEACGIPPFRANLQGAYVMNCELALFAYLRLFRFQTSTLRQQDEAGRRIFTGGASTLAVGTAEQINAVESHLNGLLESEKSAAATFQAQARSLQTRFEGWSVQLDYAIASRRLHGKCDLVSFW